VRLEYAHDYQARKENRRSKFRQSNKNDPSVSTWRYKTRENAQQQLNGKYDGCREEDTACRYTFNLRPLQSHTKENRPENKRPSDKAEKQRNENNG